MAERAQAVYAADISYGSTPFRRGHWADRLAAINADLALLDNALGNEPVRPGVANTAILRAAAPTQRPTIPAKHTAPDSFHPGSELALTIATPPTVTDAILWYRHVNHGERWLSTPMQHWNHALAICTPQLSPPPTPIHPTRCSTTSNSTPQTPPPSTPRSTPP